MGKRKHNKAFPFELKKTKPDPQDAGRVKTDNERLTKIVEELRVRVEELEKRK